jgi:tRNA(fMet)-specific endonuclease VapC
MTGSNLLLDSNAVIALIRREGPLLDQLALAGGVHISLFTWGEMHYGAEKSRHPDENRRALRSLLNEFQLVLPSADAGEFYGRICNALRRRGRPIPANDVWIAALALQHNMPIITRDAHFREVEGLEVLGW